MWKKWVKWHEEYRPDLISAEEPIIQKIHTSGKYRFAGRDRDGCPILIIRMRYHVKGLATAEENLRYLLFMIENGRKLAEQSSRFRLTQKLTSSQSSSTEGTWPNPTKSPRRV